MNESDLLSRKIACSAACRYGYNECGGCGNGGGGGGPGATGSTGPKGPIGPSGPGGGISKSFTILVNYQTTSSISKVYIPPGLFLDTAYPGLSAGGIFTSNQGSDLSFAGINQITLNNTTYEFLAMLSVSGYISGGPWQPVPGPNLGSGKVGYSVIGNNSVQINLPLGFINGGNLGAAQNGFGSGYLVAVFLVYS
jgi:hypothetical protein